jgi:regulator of cell morphogenesis and NO signaling
MNTPLIANPETSSLGELIANIEATHHTFTREALARIETLLESTPLPDQSRRTALIECFRTLHADLLPHLLKEENILFPYIVALERDPANPPHSCFGSVANPIAMMQMEHATCLELLEQLRSLTDHYKHLAGSIIQVLYDALAELDADLVEHIHWEDHVLFPRALQLEAAA